MRVLYILFAILFFIVLIISRLFKLQHWPGANNLYWVSWLLLALAIFTNIAYTKKKRTNALNNTKTGTEHNNQSLMRALQIVFTVLFVIVLIISRLFKLQHWPWASELYWASWGLLALAIFTKIAYNKKKRTKALNDIKIGTDN